MPPSDRPPPTPSYQLPVYPPSPSIYLLSITYLHPIYHLSRIPAPFFDA